jgi:hypothetical protein
MEAEDDTRALSVLTLVGVAEIGHSLPRRSIARAASHGRIALASRRNERGDSHFLFKNCSFVLGGDGVEAHPVDKFPQRIERRTKLRRISRAQHDIGAETLVLEERVAADLDVRVRRLELG